MIGANPTFFVSMKAVSSIPSGGIIGRSFFLPVIHYPTECKVYILEFQRCCYVGAGLGAPCCGTGRTVRANIW